MKTTKKQPKKKPTPAEEGTEYGRFLFRTRSKLALLLDGYPPQHLREFNEAMCDAFFFAAAEHSKRSR